MNVRLTIDKAGRVVIPEHLREELHLEPGDSLDLESAGEQITLRPVSGTVRILLCLLDRPLTGLGSTLTVGKASALPMTLLITTGFADGAQPQPQHFARWAAHKSRHSPLYWCFPA